MLCQAIGSGQVREELFGVGLHCRGRMTEAGGDLFDPETEGFGFRPPPAFERGVVDAVLLRLAGGERCGLTGARRVVAGFGDHVLNLVSPLRELIDHVLGHAFDLGPTVVNRFPADPQSLAQQVPEVSLVEQPSWSGVVVDGTCVDGLPTPFNCASGWR